MATTTMRELAVPSPAPAFTLLSGSGIDENQNSSHVTLKSAGGSQKLKEQSQQCNGKNKTLADPADSTSSEEGINNRSGSPHSTGDDALTCATCHLTFATREYLQLHNREAHTKLELKENDGDCSIHPQDCFTSNNLESNSPKSEEPKTGSPESEDSVLKSLRSARRTSRREDGFADADADTPPRRKHRSVNNNESTEEEPQCPACGRDFTSWSVLHVHLKTAHPERDLSCELCHVAFDSPRDLSTHRSRVHNSDGKKSDLRKKLQFDLPKCRIDRKNLKNIPKVIGFQDINFIDFSSEKFPLVAKDVCEKSLHLSKDEFCFECRLCGRGFPCSSALEIHTQTCESNQKKEEKEIVKRNKRKSTPKFRPQAITSDSDESDDNIKVNLNEKRRNDFFNSLDLRNNGVSSKSPSHKSSEDEADRKLEGHQERREAKLDLADIQSMISVTNIPGINMNNFQMPTGKLILDEKPPGLKIQVNNSQPSPGSLSMTSPNFTVLSLISPNYASSDHTEEEAQDCFAAECRRMKLRGEFPCKLCTQIFPNLRALKGHNRVHVSVASGTPSSPYRCNICSYNSLDKATLVRHMRSHNGDRPYECAMCNYAFTTKANCERHLRNRHSKMTRDDVKSSIIYHPSEDPINDSEYLRTSEMNKKNIEKSKEVKQEFSLPINLKINLAALKERQKTEDLFQAEHQELLKNISNGTIEEMSKSEAGTMTEDLEEKIAVSSPAEDQWSGEEALDLRVNKCKYDTPPSECSDEPEDLTKKEGVKEFNNNVEEVQKTKDSIPFPSPPFEQKSADISGLVKMYSAMYPSLSMTQVHQIILTQLNFPGLFQRLSFPSFLMPQSVFHNSGYPKSFLPKDALGLQMSGGSIMDENKSSPTISEKLQYFQQEALAKIILKREKDRIANDFYKKSQESPEKPRLSNEYFTESDKKAFQEILVNREVENKPVFPVSKPIESVVENRNTSVKMVIKNGVLMPKQKQRRYRTERPFSCEHCTARFTLRSNMERHIKQQHPRFWTQKSRYNVGGGRKSDSGKLKGLGGDYFRHYEAPTQMSLHSRGDVSSSAGDLNWEASKSPTRSYKTGEKSDESDGEEPKDLTDEEESKDDLIIDEGGENNHLRLLANVTEYLKAKQTEIPREESQDTVKDSQPQDLASVSKMLDNAVTQTQAFQKYFQEGARKDEEDYRREEGDRSEEEEGLVAGSTSSDENRSESEATSKSTKKKSAYSLAPNRVSCPYCFRKFPWTSSLRRHVLTHTGQKPFKCTHCPLLFTTKSNCDRHLLRKHGREALIASSGQTENHEGAGNGSGLLAAVSSSQSNAQQQPNYSLRNVPERPYKCTHCPSSTFSSLSNLTKHMSSKHPNGQILSPEPAVSPDHVRVKNLNPLAPPNVTISPTFPINIPKALSIIPQYQSDSLKTKRFPITVPSIRVQEWPSGACNGDREDEGRSFRKRSSSDETEASDRKRTSPDLLKVSPAQDSHSDAEACRSDLPPIPASELPFKCHLCEGSFGERSEALDHIRIHHPGEFQLLMSKGALETTSEEDRVPHDDHDEVDHSRGRFPDYAHRKVMCAFCMRRFWSAEDLRRHMRTHTGERPFSCNVCLRKFTLKHSMLRHRKKHNPHDEVLVGSDEELHNNNVGSTTSTSRRFADSEDSAQHKTILHQTLTRREDDRPRSEEQAAS